MVKPSVENAYDITNNSNELSNAPLKQNTTNTENPIKDGVSCNDKNCKGSDGPYGAERHTDLF